MRFYKAAVASALAIILLSGSASALKQEIDVNLAPRVVGKQCTTLKNIPIWGYIEQYDPDGDKTEVSITKSPEKGSVTLYGSTFVYKPYPDETGLDNFSVIVTDSNAKASQDALISIEIGENDWDAGYSDMKGNPAHYSAIMLAKNNIISGERIGSADFFNPKKELTHAEFLVMLLAAAKSDADLAPCVNTEFANDSEISLWLKPYVRYATQQDLIDGEEFHPNQVITRNEATMLVAKAAGIKDVRSQSMYIKDVGNIPAESLQSYMNLYAYNMLSLYDEYARPLAALTRADAADLLWQLSLYKQRLPISKGVAK